MEIFLIIICLGVGTWYAVRLYFQYHKKPIPSRPSNPLDIDKGTFLHGLKNLSIKSPHVHDLVCEIEQYIYGDKKYAYTLIATCIAGGHVIIQGPPGTGKTVLVKTFATLSDLRYGRVQCTPDLLPQDILGYEMLHATDQTLVYQPGPIFSQVLHIDEINRTTPKLQSAFLEAMQERQVTLFGKTYSLPTPFFLIATQNPYDAIGTFMLPYAQVDRFMAGIITSHITGEDEISLMKHHAQLFDKQKPNHKYLSADDIVSMQQGVASMYVSDDILAYAVQCIQQCKNAGFQLSVRVTQALLGFARSLAYLEKADSVRKEHVILSLLPILHHRIAYITGVHVSEETVYDIMIGSLQKDDIVG